MSLIARQNVYIEGKKLQQKKRRGATIGRRTGALLESLENPHYSISALNGRFIVTSSIVKQVRFLDMKHLGNRRIYNRQVWGILHNNALPDIKYGYGEEIRDTIGRALKEAFNDTNQNK